MYRVELKDGSLSCGPEALLEEFLMHRVELKALVPVPFLLFPHLPRS